MRTSRLTAWDEMFDASGEARVDYHTLYEHVQTLSRTDFDERCATRDRVFRDQGITFALSGEERPFPLDLVPRVISAAEWSTIERGVKQHVRTLERFLDDVYGEGEIIRAGVVPRRIVVTSSYYHRAACGGIVPPGGVRVHVAGIDLVRDGNGRMCVLEDNLRTPSGISYVVENRRAMTHVFPELFAAHRVQPVSDYPARLLQTLRATAPRGVADPRVVLLTPGVHNAAYFEHSFLARQMGIELVEGRDLVCRGNVVYMRTTSGEERVDVVYRRVDDEYLDPLHFRPDSMLGCAGIVNAARAGNVTISNFVGNGVADDKAIYPYVPAMIDYYLGERAILDNVETFPLDDADVSRVGARPSRRARVEAGRRLGWQGPGDRSARHRRRARHAARRRRGRTAVVDRAAAGGALDRTHVRRPAHAPKASRSAPVRAPRRRRRVGGARRPHRVALPEGSLIVNSSQGGGSKDTWVLAGDGEDVHHETEPALAPPAVECEPLARQPFDLGPDRAAQAAQQQQQQQ